MSSPQLLTANLPSTDAFQRPRDDASLEERISISYRRARAIAKQYALTSHDVLYLTPKFWDLHMDNIFALDSAALTLLTIQYNLSAGTLAPFAEQRPDLRPLMNDIMKFNVSAQYLLTEVAHGLDAPNLETTATLLPSGEFDLHTPNEGARKFMPPTGPFGSVPRVAIVFARLMVKGENRGIRPFVVALGNGKEMCKGVSMRLLPQRGGIQPVDHGVTSFNHVRLPAASLLGFLANPANHRTHFISSIWRVSVGSLALATLSIPLLSVHAYAAARYSLRRMVKGSNGVQVPIMSFRTQQLPILLALAQAAVMKAYAKAAIQIYRDSSLDERVRSGVAAAAKAAMTHHACSSLSDLSERFGARGLFEYNQVIPSELLMRGIRIAEGDVLVLCIRLANELHLVDTAPQSQISGVSPCRLRSLFADCRALLARFGHNHRDERLSHLLLPLCLPLVQAIGHRMAYEAALDAQVDRALVDLYEANIVSMDSAWYSEKAALPHLEKYLTATAAEEYAVSPILNTKSWDSFLAGLPMYSGNAEVSLIPSPPRVIHAPVMAHL
ncbi:Acyl-coenzyme A oxidase 2, peroxisomal [Grifola frondosa]|uniref:Acyl-coenzyme A oxidase 2, peroxisomal n=1 Tax=Grifola frondosa TaxID=5627 RepID=A0A1C7M9N1_GRIFR|nr:Acyl-coenzyme A oxidase 2, peroxisomal [Grifola frondosa]